MFGDATEEHSVANQDGTSAAARAHHSFPENAWKKLVDCHDQGSVWLDFTIINIMDYFVARKEGDGLPADNLRSMSSHSFKLYTKACFHYGEMAVDKDGKSYFFRAFARLK